MSDVTLAAEERTDRGSRNAGRLRRDGKLPAIVYGLDAEPEAISVPAREFGRVLHSDTGANTLITLQIGATQVLTLARQIQRHPVRGDVTHVDFVRINRNVAVQAEVTVHLVGEAVGVRNGGLLEQLLFNLTVEARPADIPTSIEFDVSDIDMAGQVHVGDLPLPAGVVALQESDVLIAQITALRGREAGEAAEGSAEASAGGTATESAAADASASEG